MVADRLQRKVAKNESDQLWVDHPHGETVVAYVSSMPVEMWSCPPIFVRVALRCESPGKLLPAGAIFQAGLLQVAFDDGDGDDGQHLGSISADFLWIIPTGQQQNLAGSF